MNAAPRPVPVIAYPLITLLALSSGCQSAHDDMVLWGRYVGMSREKIIEQLGEPSREYPYRVGLGREEPGKEHLQTHTLEYHYHGRTLYIALEPTAGGWVCYKSASVRAGVIID